VPVVLQLLYEWVCCSLSMKRRTSTRSGEDSLWVEMQSHLLLGPTTLAMHRPSF
jgi:hypothetical protein